MFQSSSQCTIAQPDPSQLYIKAKKMQKYPWSSIRINCMTLIIIISQQSSLMKYNSVVGCARLMWFQKMLIGLQFYLYSFFNTHESRMHGSASVNKN